MTYPHSVFPQKDLANQEIMFTFASMRKVLVFILMLPLAACAQQRYLGGDISLLPSYEEQGTVYRDSDGKAVEVLPFLREQGWNAMRVRLFVNPEYAPQNYKEEGVCQDLSYAIRLSQRIQQAGFALLLDIQYSDYWADPGKQAIPHLWKDCSVEALHDSVYHYTSRTLKAFKAAGVTPELIQVGNEITNGMLWPIGKVNPMKDHNWVTLCQLLQIGCKACREECPKARIVIHTERAGDWDVTYSYYQHLRNAQVDYDIIGLSYYPMWHKSIPNLGKTLNNLATCFPDKEVMIVETAAYYSHERDIWAKRPDQYAEFYPISEEGQTQFTRELMAELRQHPNVTGLFWWFPEENACQNELLPCWLNRGLFDNHTGRVKLALYELKW